MASLKTGVAQEHEHVSSGERESMLPDQHLVEHMIVLVPLVAGLGELRDLATIERLEEAIDPFAVKRDRPQKQTRNGKADKEIDAHPFGEAIEAKPEGKQMCLR